MTLTFTTVKAYQCSRGHEYESSTLHKEVEATQIYLEWVKSLNRMLECFYVSNTKWSSLENVHANNVTQVG